MKTQDTQQTAQHTPGPWILVTIEGSASLMIGAGDGSDPVIADIRIDAESCEANARLIAAAPELLAALMELERIGELFASGENVSPLDALKAARAAIAKATR